MLHAITLNVIDLRNESIHQTYEYNTHTVMYSNIYLYIIFFMSDYIKFYWNLLPYK